MRAGRIDAETLGDSCVEQGRGDGWERGVIGRRPLITHRESEERALECPGDRHRLVDARGDPLDGVGDECLDEDADPTRLQRGEAQTPPRLLGGCSRDSDPSAVAVEEQMEQRWSGVRR